MNDRSASRAAWLQSQYDNRARVPEHPEILARWATQSARVRSTSPGVLDLTYGPTPAERLDVFVPAMSPPERAGRPILVFIHGGWWRALDKADHSFVAPALTERGAIVVVPNYALCPLVTIETIALQMTRALAWTWRHAQDFGGDPSRIFVAGHSAGGHLSALLLTCRWREVAGDLPPSLLQGALAISGVFDLEPLRQTAFLQKDLRLTRASVRRLSPALLPRPPHPMLAVAGGDESEEFLRHLDRIRDAWGQAAVPVCEAVPGRNHFTVLDALAEPGSRVHRLALALLGLE